MTLIPTIIEQSARSERAYDLISCLLKARIIPVSYTHLGAKPILNVPPASRTG